jgi:hypothetical protein
MNSERTQVVVVGGGRDLFQLFFRVFGGTEKNHKKKF